jgi:uncharacterized UBP type Zn finger protein
MIDLSEFRDKCCYCFTDSPLNVCKCNLSVCNDHIEEHINKFGCSTTYTFIKIKEGMNAHHSNDEQKDCEKSANIEKTSSLKSKIIEIDYIEPELQDHKDNLETRISEIMRDGIINKNNVKECTHIYSIDQAVRKVTQEEAKCQYCDLKENLWICISCGQIGCGRKQVGKPGNGHANDHFLMHYKLNYERENSRKSRVSMKESLASNSDHYDIPTIQDSKETMPELEYEKAKDPCYKGKYMENLEKSEDLKKVLEECLNSQDLEKHGKDHGLVFYLDSISKDSYPDTFCYICDSFVHNPYRPKIEFNSKIKGHFTELQLGNQTEKKSDASPFTGIINDGQTCYVSSVLQLIANAIGEMNFDLSIHFSLCTENPLDCFCCQLVRILNELKPKKEYGVQKIEISDFLFLMCKEMPTLTRNEQQDCSEFMHQLIDRISGYEECMLLPRITSIFSFEIESFTACSGCSANRKTVEIEKILYVGFNPLLRKGIYEAFQPTHIECQCGGTLVIQNTIVSLPLKFLVAVKRYKFEKNACIKINDKISVDYFNSEKISKKALSQHEIILTRDLEYGERKNQRFEIKSCIVHNGKSIHCGHYTWWYFSPEFCFEANDEHVKFSNVEVLEDGVVFLFD